MRLFYAQSAKGKLIITAPYKTFSSQTSFDELLGVQPYMYTEGAKRIPTSNAQIEQVNYYPKNNKHFEIEIIFAKEFNPAKGSMIYCKALFKSGYIKTFALPFVKAGVNSSKTSTQEKSLSLSRSTKLSNPVAIYKTYLSSQYFNLTAVPSDSINFEIRSFYKDYQSIEFVGGIFENVDAKILTDTFESSKGKFLEASEFVDTWKENASYFYIYSDNLSLDDFSKTGGGCLDSLASNYNSNAEYNNNSCVYETRPPENIKIQTIVGNKNEASTVTYIEEKLPRDDYDDIGNFNIISYSSKGVTDTTPTVQELNISDVYSTLRISWEDAKSSLGLDILENTVGHWAASIIISENIFSTTSRSFSIPVFKSSNTGCLDNTALNYDATATIPCQSCCIDCDKTQLGLELGSAAETINVSSDGILSSTTGTFIYENSGLQQYLSNSPSTIANNIGEYLITLAPTVWTANFYNASQIELNVQNYTQANITGSPLDSLVNAGNSGVEVIFSYSGGGELVVGNEYYLELIFNNGTGCTYYKYIPFNIPFNGCSDPTATNYDPSPLNSGLGNCEYPSNDACEENIIAFVSNPLILENNNSQYTITTEGIVQSGGPTAQIAVMSITSVIDGNATVLQNSTVVSPASTNTSISANLILQPGQTATVYVLNQLSGCFETFVLTAPFPTLIEGCTDPTAANYNPIAELDNGTCIYCSDLIVEVTTTPASGSCESGNSTNGRAQFTVFNNPGNFQIDVEALNPEIGYIEAVGPMDINVLDTGTILPSGNYIARTTFVVGLGLTCRIDINFTIESDTSDCGCTNPEAENYNPEALIDDGSCRILGCTDRLASNFNINATVDDGTCLYSVVEDGIYCIPKTVDYTNSYEVTLENIKKCISKEGTTMLLKIKSGIECSTTDQLKLTLVSYLLNRIGLHCMYNCNYSYDTNPLPLSCEELWNRGGPSGPNLVYSSEILYRRDDIVEYNGNYWVCITGQITGIAPGGYSSKWKRCEDVNLPSGSETYLETFINFARKFCTVCFSDQPQANIGAPAININNALRDINLENGDNIEL